MTPRAYKRYLLTVLLIILAFNQTDRLALGVLLQDIKVDLRLSDTQLGFLSGIAFALFYAVMGVPIARWADRGNRVTIISMTAALWSAAVAACGMAANFLHLLLIRMGVAVGEAGCVPPAHSLIAEHFTRAERPRAFAIYMQGGPLAVVFGYFLAGWLNQLYGWRMTFILLGLPGVVVAVIAWLTLKEPRRTTKTKKIAKQPTLQDQSVQYPQPENALSHLSSPPETPALRDVAATLWRTRSFRHLLLFFSVLTFFGYGIAQWQPAFFIRSYGLQTGELGTWFAVIWGVGGVLGTYVGGEWASRSAANNERLQLRAMAVVYSSFGLLSAGIYLSTSLYLAFGLLAVAAAGVCMVSGPLFATIQTLVPERMRALSIAIVYLFANLIGMGLGPLAAGALSDAFRPVFGEESLRYALLALSPGYFWGAWHLWCASKSVAQDLRQTQWAHDQSIGDAADARGAASPVMPNP